MKISETVKKLRKEKGWTQARLAMEANISQQAVSFIERGRNEPSAEMIRTLADTFGVSISELMGEDQQAVPAIVREEQHILAVFRRLNRAGRDQLLQYLDYLETRPEYKKGAEKAL